MERGLRPERLEVIPSAPEAARTFKHWLFVFSRYKSTITAGTDDTYIGILANSISSENFEIISECITYDTALAALKDAFIKPVNAVVARHKLSTRKQLPNESVDEYVRSLQKLSLDCNFTSVSTETYRDEYIRDAFITGISSQNIRTRLLENRTLSLTAAIDQARALEIATSDSQIYDSTSTSASRPIAATKQVEEFPNSSTFNRNEELVETSAAANAAAKRWTHCYGCGSSIRHDRSKCPARNVECHKCKKSGHFSKVCMSKNPVTASAQSATLACVPSALKESVVEIYINGFSLKALLDTGSSENFLSKSVVHCLQLPVSQYNGTISMAAVSLKSSIKECCILDIKVQDRSYPKIRFLVLPDSCTDVILGLPFLSKHSSFNMKYGGPHPNLEVCALASLDIDPPRVFTHLSPECRPVITKSRKFKDSDAEFIRSETERLLKEGIIEPSDSPWRAQVHVVNNQAKRRLVIDYSTTINKFTYLDAYPLPNLDQLVNKISSYKYYSCLDLRSAYHCVPLHRRDKIYTAFEANGGLYQFTRLAYGLTNGVACFQRIIDNFIVQNKLKKTHAYLDDVTIGGDTMEEHDENLANFLTCAKNCNMTLNKDKCVFSTNSICILGYQIRHNELRPDPSRLSALKDMPLPQNKKSLSRMLGLFAYYSKWLSQFSQRIRPLVTTSFPLSDEAIQAVEDLKSGILNSVKMRVDETLPFTLETDASDFAIGATLNQDGRPVAFFSRTLNSSEKHHAAVEKEAYAIVEALKRWRHFLVGRRFTLITDQKSVAYIFDVRHRSKIKNEKIERWRLELMPYKYDVQHRAGSLNVAADALSREFCAATSNTDLVELHKNLCHPGVTRMLHFIRVRNLPYSVDDVKSVTSRCSTCQKCKPQFYRPEKQQLIRAMRPFDRISIDFKGPLPSSSSNKYLLIVVDEYSRFPFAFPCKDISSASVISCLTTLFSIFGLPGYVHSDRGASFMSSDLKSFLHTRGIPTSRSTPYHPMGNGQCERFVGSVWKTVTLCLESKNLPIQAWELVLPDALHSLRSLLCTSTNCTPHERMFSYSRKSASGTSMPTWLTNPGKVLLRKFVRSKDEPLVQEVQLLESNPLYAHIKYPNGREDTVAIKDLAPSGEDRTSNDNRNQIGDQVHETPPPVTLPFKNSVTEPDMPETQEILTIPRNIAENLNPPDDTSRRSGRIASPENVNLRPDVAPRRTGRISRPVDRYGYS